MQLYMCSTQTKLRYADRPYNYQERNWRKVSYSYSKVYYKPGTRPVSHKDNLEECFRSRSLWAAVV